MRTAVLLLLFACTGARAQEQLCQSEIPDQSLVDALSVCRGLNYPFCVVRDAGDVSDDIGALAVERDRDLALRYQTLSPVQSQRCVHAWVNKVCSETFVPLDAPNSAICQSVCDEIEDHCVGISCGDVESGPGCHDFFAKKSEQSATCFSSDSEPGAPRDPPPQIPIPRPRSPFRSAGSATRQFRKVELAALALLVSRVLV